MQQASILIVVQEDAQVLVGRAGRPGCGATSCTPQAPEEVLQGQRAWLCRHVSEDTVGQRGIRHRRPPLRIAQLCKPFATCEKTASPTATSAAASDWGSLLVRRARALARGAAHPSGTGGTVLAKPALVPCCTATASMPRQRRDQPAAESWRSSLRPDAE